MAGSFAAAAADSSVVAADCAEAGAVGVADAAAAAVADRTAVAERTARRQCSADRRRHRTNRRWSCRAFRQAVPAAVAGSTTAVFAAGAPALRQSGGNNARRA